MMEDVKARYEKAQSSFSEKDPGFQELSEEEREELRQFFFLSLLAFDVYLKKQLMEKIVDDMAKKEGKDGGKKRKG